MITLILPLLAALAVVTAYAAAVRPVETISGAFALAGAVLLVMAVRLAEVGQRPVAALVLLSAVAAGVLALTVALDGAERREPAGPRVAAGR
ncbi:hypothetical protein [Actinomadura sp. GTD37]|uniref:hypothetical protein n=1 Tax=Actinomadura sp. GTD37 TaxID=1778030 RepID=UPI0035C0FDBF